MAARILLDTHVWLWFNGEPERLSEEARRAFVDPENDLFLSAASTWEIAIKHAAGRLELPAPPAQFIPTRLADNNVRPLAIQHSHTLAAAELPLPRRVMSHGWWLMDGAKMSKSLGNVVRPQDYIELFGLDGVRYFVFREMVFGQDADFADAAILTRYNSDLANDFGNLVSRATTMIQRSCGGVVPSADVALLSREPERDLTAAATAINGVVSDPRTLPGIETLAAVGGR